MIEVNNEKNASTWETTLSKSMKNSIWPHNDTKTSSQKQSTYPNQWFSPLTPATNKFKSILAPPKLIFGKDKLENRFDDLNLSNHQNNNKMSKKEFDQDSFLFKKPLPLPPTRQIKNLEKDSILNRRTLREKNSREISPALSIEGDASENESDNKPDILELKKKLRDLVIPKSKEKSKNSKIFQFFSYLMWFLLCLSPIAVIIVIVVTNSYFSNELCNPLFKFDKISEDLKNHVHGQDVAIRYLTEYFNDKNNKTGFDVLAFIGGIGVGKSHTSEIIKNNLKDSVNLLEYFPPLYKKVDQAHTSLSICKCNVIRLDNLRTYDILDAVQFIVQLKKQASNYCTLILSIFNTQETDFNLKKVIDLDRSIMEIEEKFQKAKLQPIISRFEPLNEEALTWCINDAANYANVELSSDALEHVKRDLVLSDSGCKGAYSKVQIVGKPKKQDL